MAATTQTSSEAARMAEPAIRVSRQLLDILQQLQGTSKLLVGLANDAQSLVASITWISTVDDHDWHLLDANAAREAADHLEHCRITCQFFIQRVEVWIGQPADQAVAWRNRVSVRLRRREAVRALSVRLQDCKRKVDTARQNM